MAGPFDVVADEMTAPQIPPRFEHLGGGLLRDRADLTRPSGKPGAPTVVQQVLGALLSSLSALGPGRGTGPMPFFMNPNLRKPPVVSRSDLGAYRPGFDAAGEVAAFPQPRPPVAGEGMDVTPNVGPPRRVNDLIDRPQLGPPGQTRRVGEQDLNTLGLPANQNRSDKGIQGMRIARHADIPDVYQVRDGRGRIVAEVEARQEGRNVHIEHIGAVDPDTGLLLGTQSGRGALGAGTMRAILRDMEQFFPGATQYSGARVSGARVGTNAWGDDATFRIGPPPKKGGRE